MAPPMAGEFLDTASAAGDDLKVRVFEWDGGEHAFGPVRWSPMGGALPEAGDEAVIVERDDGVWQVIAWWSGSQDTGVGQAAVDALDGRVDALEAKTTRGTSSVTWPGGSSLSTATTVTHGLGTTPAGVQVTPIYQVDGAGFTAQVSNVGATTFDVKLSVDSFSPIAATSRSFYWTVTA